MRCQFYGHWIIPRDRGRAGGYNEMSVGMGRLKLVSLSIGFKE